MNPEDRCIQEIIKAYEIARNKLGLVLDFPTIKWDLRGTVAGRAYYHQNLIQLNRILLRDNVERFIARTPWHEAAHLIAFRKHGGGIDPHGKEWSHIMWAFSKPATRCHTYDTTSVGGRKQSSLCTEIR